jgi:hypothetical protein
MNTLLEAGYHVHVIGIHIQDLCDHTNIENTGVTGLIDLTACL